MSFIVPPTPIPRAHPGGGMLVRSARDRAASLVCMVRDESADSVGAFLDRLDRQNLYALTVVLACMVPDDRSMDDLLDWIDADEHGTTRGYRRHRRLGEDACPPCLRAQSGAERKRTTRAAS